MNRTVTLKPGARGTKRLQQQYGERLFRVRYRYDATRGVCVKTVELAVSEKPWQPGGRARRGSVWLRIGIGEEATRRRVIEAGGVWHPRRRRWSIPYHAVTRLNLENLIVED